MSNLDRKRSAIRLHLIGNAHIDPAWLWRWVEGYQAARATFRTAIDLLQRFPQFVFTASQAVLYRWVEESEPALIERVRRYTREGRWAVVGGWWVEPDCNIPCGESFARQGLYGQRYLQQTLGISCRVGYCVDSFGHSATMPQLLRESGLNFYVFMRPDKKENPECPDGPFWWEGLDGTKILAYRIVGNYWTGADEMKPEWVRELLDSLDAADDELMMFYGVGDHGGGPTVANIESIISMQNEPSLPQLEFSSPDRYFRELYAARGDLPVYRGELQYHARGCYAAHAEIKKLNRWAEHTLLAAERWATVADTLRDVRYPSRELEDAWRTVLFNQAHDILGGTTIREACCDACVAFSSAIYRAERILNRSLQAIAARADTAGGEAAVVVFNLHAFPVQVAVEQEIMSWPFGQEKPSVVDDNGEHVRWQRVPISATVPRGGPQFSGRRLRMRFIAKLPPLGYRVYSVIRDQRPAQFPDSAAPKVHETRVRTVNGYPVEVDGRTNIAVENEHLRLEFDARLGTIRRLLDKRSETEVLAGPAALGAVAADPSDTWSHGVSSFGEPCGYFNSGKIKVMDSGPVMAVVRSKTSYHASTLVQDFFVFRELPWVEVRAVVRWHETLKILKLVFSVQVAEPVATFEVPYGAAVRPPDGQEVPGQGWVDVTGRARGLEYGFAILNDSKYSFDVLGSEIRMTVLRSPVYAHHTPKMLSADADYAYMSQGRHEFRYALVPHAGSWQDAGISRLAQVFNAPPRCLSENTHAGVASGSGYGWAEASNVNLVVLKVAEDGDDLIVRCQETAGLNVATTLHLPIIHRAFAISLRPWQVATWRVPRDPADSVIEVNFLEE